MRLQHTLPVLVLTVVCFVAEATAKEAEYRIDPEHTNVEFEIDHLFSRIRGRFERFEGRFAFDPKTRTGRGAQLSIEVASIDTLVEKRDGHLRSADFFEVEKYPRIRFEGKRLRPTGEGRFVMEGMIEIRGIEKPISLDVEYRGEAADPWGATRASFVLRGRLDRRDFGMSWNQTVENDVLLIGNEVELLINVEAIRQ